MPNHILTMLALGCALLAWGTAPVAAQPGAPSFELNVQRINGADGGKLYQIASSATVATTPAVVWRILTDYKRLADFVPDLKSARVVSRNGSKVIVEQVGGARFLYFSHTIRLLVQVHEQAPDRIDISLIDGDMKVYRASWELSPLTGAAGTSVVYTAEMEPTFYVPGIVGESLVRKNITRMMAAVLLRLDREK